MLVSWAVRGQRQPHLHLPREEPVPWRRGTEGSKDRLLAQLSRSQFACGKATVNRPTEAGWVVGEPVQHSVAPVSWLPPAQGDHSCLQAWDYCSENLSRTHVSRVGRSASSP